MEHPSVVDWSWLADTYWYVPVESLPALRLDPSENTLTWVVDQTVWQLTGYRDGYFWGVCVAFLYDAGEEPPQRGPGSAPRSFSMLGSITPEGRVHLTFIATQTGNTTIGIGRMLPHRDGWSFQMQMSSGDRNRTAHWAYMVQTRPGEPSWDSLPGVGLSVPEMLEGTEAPQAPAAVDLLSLCGTLKSAEALSRKRESGALASGQAAGGNRQKYWNV